MIGLLIGAFVGFQIRQSSDDQSATDSTNTSIPSTEDLDFRLAVRTNQKLWKILKQYDWVKINGQLLSDADYQVFLRSFEELLNDERPQAENYRTHRGDSRPVEIIFGRLGSEIHLHIRSTPETGFEMIDPENETVLSDSVLPQHKKEANENIFQLIQKHQKEAQQVMPPNGP
jgi:hypothetical protein